MNHFIIAIRSAVAVILSTISRLVLEKRILFLKKSQWAKTWAMISLFWIKRIRI